MAADHLELDLTIDPEREHLDVVATYSIPAGEVPQELGFYLHKNFTLTSVEGDGVESHSFGHGDSFLDKAGKRLQIIPKEATRNAGLEFRVAYAGVIPEAFQGEWMEFVVDVLWFPMHESLARKLTAEVHVSLPDGYTVFGCGETRQGDGAWRISMVDPSIDLNWIASRELEVRDFQRDGETVTIATTHVDDGPANKVADQIAWIMGWYNETFGRPAPKHRLALVMRPLDRLSGYARPGYIALHVGNDFETHTAEYFQFFAHEVAHLWWSQGDSSNFENWLNESFAEYSSMLALRASGDYEAFERLMESKRGRMGGLPPVIGIERTSPHSEAVFYTKGCVLLQELEAKIGEEEFLDWLQGVVTARISRTDALLLSLEDVQGADVASWFEQKLMSAS
ncbi:MAG: hypothetical protein ACI8QZ_003065 [Chlamydiales bacterium]|jgi:hypothetical protein